MIEAAPSRDWNRSLKGVYLFLFGSFFLWTYVPRYLDILGWSGTMIGIALAARTVAQGSAMLIWSFLADRWRAGSTFVRIQVVLGWLAVFMLVWTRDPYGLVAILTLYGLTVGCTAALLDALAVREVGPSAFGRLRSWGSAGFALVAVAVALFGHKVGHVAVAESTPVMMAVLMVGAVVCAFRLPKSTRTQEKPGIGEAVRLLSNPWLVLSLFLGAVHWASHVPYNLFLVFLCEERGFGGWLPGVSLAVGVVGEVIALAYATSISRRLRPEWILVAAVGVASLRWTLTAWLTVAWLLCALQFLHGITFGLFLICVMSILDREVPLALRASGQALLYLVVFAMGSAMGNLLTGILLDHTKPSQMFAVWGGIEALLVVPCLLMALRQKGPAKEEL